MNKVNSIPDSVRSAGSLLSFRHHLKTHLFDLVHPLRIHSPVDYFNFENRLDQYQCFGALLSSNPYAFLRYKSLFLLKGMHLTRFGSYFETI